VDDDRRRPGTDLGDKWALGQVSRYGLGISTAAKADIRTVLALFQEHRRELGRGERHLATIGRAVAILVAAGVTDLADDKVDAVATLALARHKACRYKQKTKTPATGRTKNCYLNGLRTLGAFAVKRRLIVSNPFALVDKFPEPRKSKPTYSLAELRTMLADDRRNDPWFPFVALAAYTGCRSTTLRLLTWGMVDRESRRIRIPAEIQKCQNDTRIPIQPELSELLDQWKPGLPKARILPSMIAKMNSDRSNEQMQAYLRRCGIDPDGRSVHCFRHSCAALLTATGMGTFSVMDALGHTNVATSKHYNAMADLFREQVKRERWNEGEFYLRRKSPAAQAAVNA